TIQFIDRKVPFPLGRDAPAAPATDWGNFTVTGVIDGSKYDSHLTFDALASSSTLASLLAAEKLEDRREDWQFYFQSYTYALLQEGKSGEDLANVLNDIVKRKETEIKSEHASGFKLAPQALSDVALGLANNDTDFRLPMFAYY